MLSKRQLGIFLGSNTLSIVETERQKTLNVFDAPHSLFDQNQQQTGALPETVKLTAILQKALRDNHIDTTGVHLALPAKDIILRSFVIPWMATSEIRGVVDFEVRRFIPFKIDDLAYVFHSAPFNDKNKKRLRILFVAIRRDTLEWYRNILDQAGLNTETIEPASISLLRILAFKKVIRLRQKIAIVQAEVHGGTIIILDEGLPQFVRDFSIFSTRDAGADIGEDAFRARLSNEIRISIDYYRRQHTAEGLERLIFISSAETKDMTNALADTLKIPISSISPKTLLGAEGEIDFGSIYALGACSQGAVPLAFKIDLSKAVSRAQEAEKKAAVVPINIASSLKLAVGCLCAVFLIFLLTSRDAVSYQQKLSFLKKQSVAHQKLTVSDIQKKEGEITRKLSQLKTIRTKSDVAFFLSRVPDLLPQGVWLKNFDINYEDSQVRDKTNREVTTIATKISLNLDGYVFLDDPEQQVAQINLLISNLRSDEELLNIFDTITLKGARKEDVDGHTVTSFQLTCN